MSNVVLHIGFEKTGTTSIQYWLRDHELLLAEHGYRFPRGWLRLNCHQELPLTVMRLDRLCSPRELADEWRDPEWRIDVMEQVVDDLECNADMTTILSSENLDLLRHDDEFETLRELVGDAKVIVYLREPFEWLAALRIQYLHKNGPNRHLSDDRDAYNYLRPDTWRVDYLALLRGWRRHFSHLTVKSYDANTDRDRSVVPSFLRYLGVPVIDVHRYFLNQRHQEMPRAPGNRAENGLRFGEYPADSQLSDVPRLRSV